MNKNLKAVILEVSGGDIHNHHLNLHGAFGLFPDDCFGGSNEGSAGRPISLSIADVTVETDIDEAKAIFRERGAIRRFFETQNLTEGDLILIERIGERDYRLSKASKRGFSYYL